MADMHQSFVILAPGAAVTRKSGTAFWRLQLIRWREQLIREKVVGLSEKSYHFLAATANMGKIL